MVPASSNTLPRCFLNPRWLHFGAQSPPTPAGLHDLCGHDPFGVFLKETRVGKDRKLGISYPSILSAFVEAPDVAQKGCQKTAMNGFRSGRRGVGGGLQRLGGHLFQLTSKVGPLLHAKWMKMMVFAEPPHVTPGAGFLDLSPIFIQRQQ